jgi:hypothetical protein
MGFQPVRPTDILPVVLAQLALGRLATDKMSMFRFRGADSTFIEFRPVARVFLQDLARSELVVGLREPIHFIDNLL